MEELVPWEGFETRVMSGADAWFGHSAMKIFHEVLVDIFSERSDVDDVVRLRKLNEWLGRDGDLGYILSKDLIEMRLRGGRIL